MTSTVVVSLEPGGMEGSRGLGRIGKGSILLNFERLADGIHRGKSSTQSAQFGGDLSGGFPCRLLQQICVYEEYNVGSITLLTSYSTLKD